MQTWQHRKQKVRFNYHINVPIYFQNKLYGFIQEALELSSLIPELDQKGVNLVGVVHEDKGAKEFQPFLNSPLYLDEEVNKC